MQNQPVPKTVYATFSGNINQESLTRIFNNLGGATQQRVKTVHLLFESNGGVVSQGVALFNTRTPLPPIRSSSLAKPGRSAMGSDRKGPALLRCLATEGHPAESFPPMLHALPFPATGYPLCLWTVGSALAKPRPFCAALPSGPPQRTESPNVGLFSACTEAKVGWPR